MKLLYFSAIFSVFLFSYKDGVVQAQAIQPYYGGAPAPYSRSNDNDDLGILLTILLLATKNNHGCCCCSSNNVPIPYPIAIPTSTNVFVLDRKNGEDDGDCPEDDVINIVTNNNDQIIAQSSSSDNSKTNNNNNSSSSSASNANS